MNGLTRFSVISVFALLAVFLGGQTVHAAAISCGGCHSTPPVDNDNCAGNARGLHGTHYNYSSSTMPDTDTLEDKCAYCHTAATSTAPTVTHNNNYVNVTSTSTAPGLSWDGAGDTCTDACHKNNGMAAQWGNYTSPGISLSCQSCHDDSSDATGLSGAHFTHMSTLITVTGLGSRTNYDCDACHPDNRSDLWSGGKADDGTVKAYPHASDGTNVNSDNASLDAGISASRGAGATDTCANACHSNYSSDQWGATSLTCNSCHYYTSGTIMGGPHAAHVINMGFPCSYCHSVPSAGDTSHATSLPPAADNATVIADPGPNAGASWNDVTDTCSNTGTGCHMFSDVCWSGCGALHCNDCHNYPSLNNWTSAGNGHLVQYGSPVVNTHLGAATDYNALTDTYAAVTADASKCGKCHSGGVHKNGTVNVAGNGNNICGTGDFTVTVNTTFYDVTCSNVSCHSGKVTPNWY